MNKRIKSVFNKLKPREQDVLEMRFGLNDGEQKSLEQIGEELGISKERVRQIQSIALRRLRSVSNSEACQLKDYL